MSGGVFSLFDMAIAGVPVVAFCIWQLVSINREIARDKIAKDRITNDTAAKPPAASPDGAGHPVGEHRLDDR